MKSTCKSFRKCWAGSSPDDLRIIYYLVGMRKNLFLLCLMVAGTFQVFAMKKAFFIGNSYTYVNNLPDMISRLVSASGDSLYYASSAPGGYTLQGHSTLPATLNGIASGDWDFVILQEQSQIPSFPQSQVEQDMYPYAVFLDSLVHAAGPCTRTVFFMTWGRKYGDASNCASWPPVCTYAGMQEQLRYSYLHIADSVGAVVAPVGVSFSNSISADSTLDLYQGDFSHPNVAGTYLAACTFYATLYRRSPVGNPYISSLSPNTAAILQQIAASTVLDSLGNWFIGKRAEFSYTLNGLNAQFSSIAGSSFTHSWSFGGTSPDPSYSFPAPGNYTVTHIVCDSCGCDSATQGIQAGMISVPEILWQQNITLSPVPLQKKYLLKIQGLSPETSLQMTIFSLAGSRISEYHIPPEGSLVIDYSPWRSGIYVLNLRDEKGAVKYLKMLVE